MRGHRCKYPFENTHIKFVERHKHLGLTLSYDGKLTDHIHNVKTSAAKVLGIMQKLKFSFSRNALNQIYFSYLLPVLPLLFGTVVQPIILIFSIKFKMRLPAS